MMGLGFNNMSMGGFGGIGILLIILILALVAYKQNLFSWFFKEDDSNKKARDILAEKYSSGEISKEEYDNILNILNDRY